ncbi:hypothetical protein [Actinoplanes sichuanensis]|uniref:Uncharacterized protein n=1 Tax=Actinoplanes sichuanensis TaxID=512349 RepID=A0ABW4ADD8_9ACTN|nr:hypothetical protein [Actinoplanes sichuanensis]
MIEPPKSVLPRWLPLAAAGVAGLAAAATVMARRRKSAAPAVPVVVEATPPPLPPPPPPSAPPVRRTRVRVVLLALVVGVAAGWGLAVLHHDSVEAECAEARASRSRYPSSSFSVGGGSMGSLSSLPDECR